MLFKRTNLPISFELSVFFERKKTATQIVRTRHALSLQFLYKKTYIRPMKDLSTFPVIISQTIPWGDMDAYQHVNNIMYFRYFESSRMAYFERLKLLRARTPEVDVGPILAHTSCSFIKPVVYPDTVKVGCKISKIGNTSFVMEHAIMSPKLGLVAKGEGVVVYFDFNKNHKIPVPEELRKRIEEIEGRKF